MESKLKVQHFKTWVVCGIAAVAILAALIEIRTRDLDWRGYMQLIQHGSNSQATITGINSEGECVVSYAFSIGGRNYSGTGSLCSARVGQRVTITYLVQDPSHSCLGYAGERLIDDVISSLVRGLSFPSLS